MFGRARRLAFLLAAATLLFAFGTSSAFGALPRTYQVQKLNSPNPSAGGDFGIAFVNAGDVNGDGKDDLLAGTDEHGGSAGQVFVISGADGSTIRTINAPDPSVSGTLASFGSYVGKLSDIGSCAGGTAGTTCGLGTVGAPDGVPDMLVTALGVDVPFTGDGGVPLADAGRAYVIDGATGAVLQRIDMPDADLVLQATAPGGAKKPAFGRTVLNPASQYGPTGGGAPPAAVQKGDVNGGGQPDIVVGASDFFETGATALAGSDCASNVANECLQAGRAYVYYGENIVGSNPSVTEATPDITIQNPAAQKDDLTTPVNGNRESMGYSIAPVGDLGKCNINPGAGVSCPNASSTNTPDGKPDVALSSHRTDEFGMFDVGVAHLIDGEDGSVLYTYHHPEPQPASIFAFTNYNQPAVGDLGSSAQPDVYEPAMRQNNPFTGGGRGYVMNGNFKQSGSPNSINFSQLNDPTPAATTDFGTSSAGIGDVAGAEAGLDNRNEILIGSYGPHNPGTNQDVINDVTIFSALNEKALQVIDDPDQQKGSGFGTAVAPLGDLNGDGFLDVAVGAGLFNGTTGSDEGRVYIFRSDNSPALPEPPAPPPAAPTVLAGRTIDLAVNRHRIRLSGRRARRATVRSVTLSGAIEAFANQATCERGVQVELQRRRSTRGRFTTFDRVTTNDSGDYSKTLRPRSTAYYRARLAQTSACIGAVSHREKVTVKRARRAKQGGRR